MRLPDSWYDRRSFARVSAYLDLLGMPNSNEKIVYSKHIIVIILNTEIINTSISHGDSAMTSKQLQHKCQSVHRSRSDVENDNADRIKQ